VSAGVAAPMITRLAAAAAIVFFLCTAFRSGWRRVETDFPNYYTAALCTLHGLPLRNFYDWTWFQRQINFAGVEQQLGGYPPHTPLTALPMLPLAVFSFQVAKRIWLVCNLGFLAASIWLLAKITGFRPAHLILLTFLGFGALYSNFLYGQYYVFLLFLLTLAFYCLERDQPAASGFLCGVTFGLKLYGGPFLLYFLAKRNWKAALGFASAAVFMGAVAIAMFGWADVHYYVSQVLPRALDGEVIDPYNAVNQTYSTLLRRLLFREPELNPQPVWNAPLVVFFLQPFFTLLIAGLTLVGLARRQTDMERRDFGWFVIAALLVSVSTSSYTFIVLLLPIALLLRDAGTRDRIILIAAFVALTFPLKLAWHQAFPRLWVLLALFLFAGREYWRALSLRTVATTVAIAALVASLSAWSHYRSYQLEPGRHFEPVAWQPGAIFSASPAVSRAGLIYQSIGDGKYVLQWQTNRKIEQLSFDGEAFHPFVLSPEGPVYFELVAHRQSTMMQFDPATRTTKQAPGIALPSRTETATSPDGKWIIHESSDFGWKQLALTNRETGAERVLAAGRCNNTSPAWELDSGAVIFSSDCGRSTGLPALYRARISAP
jgi:Glycosyltransferase family 87